MERRRTDNWRVVWLTGFLILGVPAFGPGLGAQEPQEAGADDLEKKWRPNFKRASAEESYGRARELFDKKSYRKAASTFKRLQTNAAEDEDKKKILAWMKACKGGELLVKCERLVAAGQAKRALFDALDGRLAYLDTPIGPQFESLGEGLKPKVVHTIDDFENVDPKLGKKYGKEYVFDPEIAFERKGCLLWKQTKDKQGYQLSRRRNIPKNWSQYDSIVFWLKTKIPSEMQIIALSPSKKKGGARNGFMAFHKPIKSNQWTRVVIEFKSFRRQAQGDLSNITSLALQMRSPKSNFEYMIDYICLVKKGSGS